MKCACKYRTISIKNLMPHLHETRDKLEVKGKGKAQRVIFCQNIEKATSFIVTYLKKVLGSVIKSVAGSQTKNYFDFFGIKY